MRFFDEGFRYQLNISNLLERSYNWSKNQEIVYRDSFRYRYSDFFSRVRKLAKLYSKLGISKGDVVAVMDWDSHRYLEHYYAVPMMGSILHMINVRLSPEQIIYTMNHAEDKIVIVHKDFIQLFKAIQSHLETVKKVIVISEDENIDTSGIDKLEGDYDDLLSQTDDDYGFNDSLDENTVATLFYTTGTTGLPKGVYFSHRQLVLHTLSVAVAASAFNQPFGLTYNDVYMPLTPMFHVHAWGVPYVATLLGVKQVYPGRYEPEMIIKLLDKEKVTFSHCVPTILHMVVSHPLSKSVDLSNWKIIIGGSALSKGLCKEAWSRGIRVTTGYGMSETCPVLTLAQLKPHMFNWSDDEKIDVYTKTGFPIPLVKIKIVDSNMNELPVGRKHQGEIVVRSPWLTMGYYKLEDKSKELWAGGWLHTQDVAYMDEEGYIKITDRVKDIIKTGGEWISSLELESIISQHPQVSEVAVIGIPDDKWGERPLAHVVLKEKDSIDEEELKKFMMKFVESGVIEKWAIPDRFVFVDEIPKTSVGKIDKKVIRAQYTSDS